MRTFPVHLCPGRVALVRVIDGVAVAQLVRIEPRVGATRPDAPWRVEAPSGAMASTGLFPSCRAAQGWVEQHLCSSAASLPPV